MDAMDPGLIETDVHVRRPIDGGADVLRQFSAGVEYHSDDGPEQIGQVHGWIGWSIFDEDVADAGDAISTDAYQLGRATAEIMDEFPDVVIDALLIDRMYLEPAWRGRRLSGLIIDDLLALLRLDPASTAVVLQPEPQRPLGGPYEYGNERDKAMARLQAGYRHGGLEPWRDSLVCWRPF